MERPATTGRKPTSLEELYQQFRLEGEDVIRLTTGKPVRNPKGRCKAISLKGRKGTGIYYHRLKFALAHGWLPDEVDHEDRNRDNALLSNLRAADHTQNMRNRTMKRRTSFYPRGVFPSGKRFRTLVQFEGKLKSLGSYATPEEASKVVEAFLKVYHGAFYRCST